MGRLRLLFENLSKIQRASHLAIDHRMCLLTGEKTHDDTNDQGGKDGEHRIPEVTHSIEASDRTAPEIVQHRIVDSYFS